MKIAALIMFKNEQFNLPNCLNSIVDVVDLVLGYDDFSSDRSAEIFESMGGVLVGQESGLKHVNGEERDIRSLLLSEAKSLERIFGSAAKNLKLVRSYFCLGLISLIEACPTILSIVHFLLR